MPGRESFAEGVWVLHDRGDTPRLHRTARVRKRARVGKRWSDVAGARRPGERRRKRVNCWGSAQSGNASRNEAWSRTTGQGLPGSTPPGPDDRACLPPRGSSLQRCFRECLPTFQSPPQARLPPRARSRSNSGKRRRTRRCGCGPAGWGYCRGTSCLPSPSSEGRGTMPGSRLPPLPNPLPRRFRMRNWSSCCCTAGMRSSRS